MIFITVNQRSYSDTELHGPFTSVDEGKRKVTDGVNRGHDGDETKYTFFEMTTDGMKEIGYVLFNDECEVRTQDIREEYFPVQQP
jgi:hypothetical protein